MEKMTISSLEIGEYLEKVIKNTKSINTVELGNILNKLSKLPVAVRRICRGAPIAPFNIPRNPKTMTMHLSFRDFNLWLSNMNIWEYWPYLHREMLLFYYKDYIKITAPLSLLETVSELNNIADELDKLINCKTNCVFDDIATVMIEYVIIALRSAGRLFTYISTPNNDKTKELLEAEINSTHACLKLIEKDGMKKVCDENMLFSEYVLNEKIKNLTSFAPQNDCKTSEINSDFLQWALPQLPDEKPFDFKKQIASELYSNAEADNDSLKLDEIKIDDSWHIVLPSDESAVLQNVSMSFVKRLKYGFGIELEINNKLLTEEKKQIIVRTATENDDFFSDLKNPKDYIIKYEDDNIIICGKTDSGSMFGLFYLEHLFFMHGAMCLKRNFEIIRHSLFNTRIVMSGLGWMQWPDEYLELLPRYGIDAIYISPYANIAGGKRYRGIGHIQSPAEVKKLIKRAKRWGLKIYCQFINQEDSEGNTNEENALTNILEEFPQIDGLILLTEGYVASPETINNLSQKAHSLKADLDIIVWNYNGAIYPENNARKVEFSKSCSPDTIQMLTWVKGAKATFDKEWRYAYDYSISVIGPSKVWAAKQLINEKEKGSKNIYARADAWNNWQFGTLPYLPFPQQWLERHDSLVKNGITGTLDSWTLGFTPNFVAELKNIYCWDNAPPREKVLRQIAGREFGNIEIDKIIKAWELFSEAIRMVPDTGHGILCNACAAPIFFEEPPERMWQSKLEVERSKKTVYAGTANAHWPYMPQWGFLYPDFSNRQNKAESYAKSYLDAFEKQIGEKGFSLKTFLKYLRLAATKIEEGLILYRNAAKNSPASKRVKAIKHVLIAEQIKNMLLSEAAILEFEDCRFKLFQDSTENKKIIKRACVILEEELVRTSDFMAIIKKDSRMGFEWEADYFYTPYILQEKITILNDILNRQIPKFIKENIL